MDKPAALKSLSVIMPVFNEEDIIEDVVRSVNESVIKKIQGSQFIIAEDGSTDSTKEILLRLEKEIPFTLISERKRKGYAAALRDALIQAKTDLVFFCDSDGQFIPTDVFGLLKEIDSNDIVSGFRPHRKDSFHRIVLARICSFLVYIFFGLKIKDIDSGFKLIRKSAVEAVLNNETSRSMKYWEMSEFILKAYLLGYGIKEVPIGHNPRSSGIGTHIYSPQKLPSIIVRRVSGLLFLKFNYKKAEGGEA